MNLFFSILKISRLNNAIISFLTIIVAAELAGGLEPLNNVILAAFTAAFITIGANVINDYYDIEIDRINKPDRPLAAGRISKRSALIYFIIMYLTGWSLAWAINPVMLIIAFIIGTLLIYYSYALKKTVLLGNLTVSLATAFAFIFGGSAVYHYKQTLFPAAFAFFFHLGREILKDIQDREGDKKAGAVTFPIKYGTERALLLIAIVFILLVIITVIPYIFGIYGIRYFTIVCLGVYPVWAFVIYRSYKDVTPKYLGQLSNLLKVDMLVGLIAIYLK